MDKFVFFSDDKWLCDKLQWTFVTQTSDPIEHGNVYYTDIERYVQRNLRYTNADFDRYTYSMDSAAVSSMFTGVGIGRGGG